MQWWQSVYVTFEVVYPNLSRQSFHKFKTVAAYCNCYINSLKLSVFILQITDGS